VAYLNKKIAELDKRSSYALDEWCVDSVFVCQQGGWSPVYPKGKIKDKFHLEQ